MVSSVSWTLGFDSNFNGNLGRFSMLQAAIAFFVLALVAMVLGAGNIAGVSMEIGRTLLWVFLALAVVSFIASLLSGRSKRLP